MIYYFANESSIKARQKAIMILLRRGLPIILTTEMPRTKVNYQFGTRFCDEGEHVVYNFLKMVYTFTT